MAGEGRFSPRALMSEFTGQFESKLRRLDDLERTGDDVRNVRIFILFNVQ